MHRGGRDLAPCVRGEALLDLRFGRPVRRERHEEVAEQGRGKGRRRGVGGDAQHRTLKHRRRLDKTPFAVGHRGEAGCHEELARPLGPGLVTGPHRLFGRRVVAVGRLEHRRPVATSVDAARQVAHLGVQAVVFGLPELAQTAGVERQRFALAQEPRVALLAELPCPSGAAGEVVEEGDPALERLGGTRARGGDEVTLGAGREVGRQELAEVPDAAPRGSGATRDDQRVRQIGRQVGHALFQGPRRFREPSGRRRRELGLGTKPVEEQTEDALQHRARVGLWVAPPALPVGQDLAAAEHRDGKVAIDPLLLVEVRVGHALEPLPPARGVRVTTAERLGRQVVEAVVVSASARDRSRRPATRRTPR